MEISDQERRSKLASAVAREVSRGWRIESQTEYMTALVRGGGTSHLFHLVLTVLTLGLWSIVWLIRGIANFKARKIMTVDESGAIVTR